MNTKELRLSGVLGFHSGGGIRQGFETCAIYKGVSPCMYWWGQHSKQQRKQAVAHWCEAQEAQKPSHDSRSVLTWLSLLNMLTAQACGHSRGSEKKNDMRKEKRNLTFIGVHIWVGLGLFVANQR